MLGLEDPNDGIYEAMVEKILDWRGVGDGNYRGIGLERIKAYSGES